MHNLIELNWMRINATVTWKKRENIQSGRDTGTGGFEGGQHKLDRSKLIKQMGTDFSIERVPFIYI